MIKYSIQLQDYREKYGTVTRTIKCPDGERRLTSMSLWYWKSADMLHNNHYPFDDLIESAFKLTDEFPSDRGFEADLRDNLKLMIRMSLEGHWQETCLVSNNNAIRSKTISHRHDQ
jgi:hypothetical protein